MHTEIHKFPNLLANSVLHLAGKIMCLWFEKFGISPISIQFGPFITNEKRISALNVKAFKLCRE